MLIKHTVGLGNDAIKNPKKYKGFMGISIRNRFFTKKNMKEYFKWCSKQFKEFVIFLMDDPDRYNLMVFKDLDEERALAKAREISDDTKKAFIKILNGLQIKNIKILQFRDFNKDDEFIALSFLIKRYIKNDHLFHTSLFTLMETIIGKKLNDFTQKKQLNQRQIGELNEKLLQYVIDEIISILYFTEKGYLIELDPTPEFLVKQLIYEGKFPDFAAQLKLGERGHIFIHPKESYYGENLLNNS